LSLSFAGFHLEIAFDPTLHIAVLRPERGDDFLLRNLRKGTSVFTVPDAFIASPVVLVKQRIYLLVKFEGLQAELIAKRFIRGRSAFHPSAVELNFTVGMLKEDVRPHRFSQFWGRHVIADIRASRPRRGALRAGAHDQQGRLGNPPASPIASDPLPD